MWKVKRAALASLGVTLVVVGLAVALIPNCATHALDSTSTLSQDVTTCGCYNTTNPSTGAIGRLFVDNSNELFVTLEDPATKDVYQWTGGQAWQRIGSSGRTYAAGHDAANRNVLYRLAGDGRPDAKQANTCTAGSSSTGTPCATSADCATGQTCSPAYDEFLIGSQGPGGSWARQTGVYVSRDLLVSANTPYAFGPQGGQGQSTFVLTKFGSSSVPTVVDTVTDADTIVNTSYAEDSSGGSSLYKRTTGAIFQLSSSSWTQISTTTSSAIYSGASTVFAVTAGGVEVYNASTGSWTTTSGATGITKIAGNATNAYALASNVLYQFTAGSWAQVTTISSVADFAVGPSHLYAEKTDGSIWQLNGSSWTNISCSGAVSATNCTGNGSAAQFGCEPSPIPNGSAPEYSDSPESAEQSQSNNQYDVLTQHNDIARSGVVTHENILTPASLSSGNFGYVGSVAIPGKIYAQPLYVEQAAVVCNSPHSPAGLQNANIAYIATLENEIVAVDVTQRTICWSTPALGCPQPTRVPGCDGQATDGNDEACNGNFDPGLGPKEGGAPGVRIGIVSTPVIDLPHDLMYVMTRVRDGADVRGRFFLNVINTRTGGLISQTEAVADTLNDRDDCSGSAIPFHPSQGTNRAGLLLLGSTVYVAFSANSGESTSANYHGHVLAFDVTNPAAPANVKSSFCATPNSVGGGIWMAGGGLASDGTNIFFSTANGAYPDIKDSKGNSFIDVSKVLDVPNPGDYPDSFVKMQSTMRGSGYTDTRYGAAIPQAALPLPQLNLHHCVVEANDQTVCDHTIFWGRERSDADLGSSGVAIVGTDWLIGMGKDGRMTVLDTRKIGSSTVSPLIQDFQAFYNTYTNPPTPLTAADETSAPYTTPMFGDPGIGQYQYDVEFYDGANVHGSPVIWDAGGADYYVFAWGEKDHLKRFRFNKTQGMFEASDAVDATLLAPYPTAHGDIASPAPGAMPAGMLSLSSNGTTNGIVWATLEEPYKTCTRVEQKGGVNGDVVDPAGVCSWHVLSDQPSVDAGVEQCPPTGAGAPTATTPVDVAGCNVLGGYVPGRLYAFAVEPDANNRLKLLWGDTMAPPISGTVLPPPGTDLPTITPNNYIPAYAKFTPPTIAHGLVLVATANNELRIYGLGSSHHPQPVPAGANFDDIVISPPPNSTTALSSLPVLASNGAGGFKVTLNATSPYLAAAQECRADGTYATPLVGDFNGDGFSDVALLGPSDFTSVDLLTSGGDGTMAWHQWSAGSIPFWASSSAATKLVGTFGNGTAGGNDGLSDIVLVGDPSWSTIPVAFANSSGSFTVTNNSAGDFTGSQTNPGGMAAQARFRLAGDFNGDGRTDIALIPQPGSTWNSIPIAFSNGDGNFTVTHTALTGTTASGFTAWSAVAGSTFVGDVNGDGRSDIIATGAACSGGWYTTPIAFSSGDGSFRVTNVSSLTTLPTSLSCPSTCTPNSCSTTCMRTNLETLSCNAIKRFVGDFNGDGRADMALIIPSLETNMGWSSPSWVSTPLVVAFSNGDGTFRVTQQQVTISGSSINGWLSVAAGTVMADFDRDGSMDVGMLGASGWTSVPLALSRGDGTFNVDNVTGIQNVSTVNQAATATGTCNGQSFPAWFLTGHFSN